MFRVTSSSITTTCLATWDLPCFSYTLHIFRCYHVPWELKFFLEKKNPILCWPKFGTQKLLVLSPNMLCWSGCKWMSTLGKGQHKLKLKQMHKTDNFLYLTLLREHLIWVITLNLRCRKVQHLILLFQNVALIPHRGLIWVPSISQNFKSLICGSLLQVLDNWNISQFNWPLKNLCFHEEV